MKLTIILSVLFSVAACAQEEPDDDLEIVDTLTLVADVPLTPVCRHMQHDLGVECDEKTDNTVGFILKAAENLNGAKEATKHAKQALLAELAAAYEAGIYVTTDGCGFGSGSETGIYNTVLSVGPFSSNNVIGGNASKETGCRITQIYKQAPSVPVYKMP